MKVIHPCVLVSKGYIHTTKDVQGVHVQKEVDNLWLRSFECMERMYEDSLYPKMTVNLTTAVRENAPKHAIHCCMAWIC